MDKHYFFVAQRGSFYVAGISFEEPKDEFVPKKEIIFATIHMLALPEQSDVQEWSHRMSAYSDVFFIKLLAKFGITNSVASTETIFSRFPGVQ